MRIYKLLNKAMIVLAGVALAFAADAAKLKKQNLAELLNASQSVIAGEVVKVTDGFDQKNRPFTEVSIKVNSAAKGKHAEDSIYKFRQFGLLKPRSMGNGKVYLGVSPDGFAKWHEGESVLAFMYKPGAITGFQTTAGMAQGKFVVRNGLVANEFANMGLFDGMDTSNFSPEESNMLTAEGAVDAATFMGLVGKLAGVEQ